MVWTDIIVALVALVGTGLGSYSGFKLTSYRVAQLEKKVDKHNNFAERVPILEEKVQTMHHMIEALERER